MARRESRTVVRATEDGPGEVLLMTGFLDRRRSALPNSVVVDDVDESSVMAPRVRMDFLIVRAMPDNRQGRKVTHGRQERTERRTSDPAR